MSGVRGITKTRAYRRAFAFPVSESGGLRKSMSTAAVTGRSDKTIPFHPAVPQDAWSSVVAVTREQSGSALTGQLRKLTHGRQLDLATRAATGVLADLVEQSWVANVDSFSQIWLTPPDSDSEEGEHAPIVKERLRQRLLASRAIQLADPAVREFLGRLEAPRLFNGQRVSVLSLIDDGSELAALCREVSSKPPSERESLLKSFIDPEIVIVSSGDRCTETGLDLYDVWRYCRHTWSLEYRPTPGRMLAFLIRNRARHMKPIMGIGAVANAALQLSVRDSWIGWTAKHFGELARNEAEWPSVRSHLLDTVSLALQQVRQDDLLSEAGPVTGAELEQRLLGLASLAREDRQGTLRNRAESQRRGKRAKLLADLLFAQRVLANSPKAAIPALTEEQERAVSIASREVRKVGLASRLLELNVCGAVPPYGELLLGKLTALAVASRELITTYRERYEHQVSEIASQMAGKAVRRSARACVISTTSLYGFSASQYNRLRLDLTPDEEGVSRVEWIDLGVTKGFGTTHFTERTVEHLRAYSADRRGSRNVNNIFGEGQSPRLRQVREALDDLGLDSTALLQHNAPRRVYALELFPGAKKCLARNEASALEQPGFDVITREWLRRWLTNRVTYRPALERLAGQGPSSVRASLSASSDAPSSVSDLFAPPPPDRPLENVMPASVSRPDLIQAFYRATAACADHHDPETVRLLHIETPVEKFIRKEAAPGVVIFVTGHPGDGKTHLLRKLADELAHKDVDICLDANEIDDDDLIRRIDIALEKKKRGLALAINEGVLVSLLHQAEGRSWSAPTRKQLMQPFLNTNGTAGPKTFVLDLNLRNNLSPVISRAALQGMISMASPCEGCPTKTCAVQRNVARMTPSVVERLVDLLSRVGGAGTHATMRDVQGFMAYLLTGGEPCDLRKNGTAGDSWYWHNAFEGGQGPLFDAIRAFDPAAHASPLLDDQLWRHAEAPEDWVAAPIPSFIKPEKLEERQRSFVDRKRRAFFEHKKGPLILEGAMSPTDDLLNELLKSPKVGLKRLVRALNTFYDKDEHSSDVLYIWSTHRYDARPNRYAVSARAVPVADLEVAVPTPIPRIASAFPDFTPAFVTLRAKNRTPHPELRVDRTLLQALSAAENGMPGVFRRGEPEVRVAAFYDKLGAINPNDPIVEIRLVDMDTGANHRIAVDTTARTYRPA
jgi:hypothetical protein